MQVLEVLFFQKPLYRELFLEQLLFLLAKSRNKAALCSRRAGKSTAVIIYALTELLEKPNSLGFYLALTDKSIKKIVNPIIHPLLKKYGIKAKWDGLDLKLANGSILSFGGANDIRKVESFRGTKMLFCIIDECASFPTSLLDYLIEEIIKPALMDTRGDLLLVGTPAKHCSGIFYDVTTGKQDDWHSAVWTCFDNPHVKDQAVKETQEYFKRKKCDASDPKYRREYLAQWCSDENSLLIKPVTFVNPGVFSVSKWRTVIGVDFGFNDKTAFSVVGWKRDDPTAYVLETYGLSGLGVSEIATELKGLKKKYSPIRFVGDPAGCTKIIMKEFQDKHQISFKSAEKNQKAHYIEIFNDAVATGNLLFNAAGTSGFVSEAKRVVWNEKRTREREGQACDHIDATLYAFREALHFTEQIQASTFVSQEQRDFESVVQKNQQKIIRDSGLDPYVLDLNTDFNPLFLG